VYPGYSAAGVNDSVRGGWPGNTSNEWASNGQGVGAWVTLTWPVPVTVREIWLYDRPNNDDQVLSGTLSFSNGADITVGALPNDASQPAKASFDPRTITWVKFTVTSVKTGCQNIGLSEFEVFEAPISTTVLYQSPATAGTSAKNPDKSSVKLFDIKGRIIGTLGQNPHSGIYISIVMRDGHLVSSSQRIVVR